MLIPRPFGCGTVTEIDFAHAAHLARRCFDTTHVQLHLGHFAIFRLKPVGAVLICGERDVVRTVPLLEILVAAGVMWSEVFALGATATATGYAHAGFVAGREIVVFSHVPTTLRLAPRIHLSKRLQACQVKTPKAE
jgi:hypothetical protein